MPNKTIVKLLPATRAPEGCASAADADREAQ
jgi:hypothetical protein